MGSLEVFLRETDASSVLGLALVLAIQHVSTLCLLCPTLQEVRVPCCKVGPVL